MRKAIVRLSVEREAEVNAQIVRMTGEGRSARTIGAAVGLNYRTVINRQRRLRAPLPTPVGQS